MKVIFRIAAILDLLLTVSTYICTVIGLINKNFEIRKNDRDFQVGDILKLKEINERGGIYW